MAKKNTNAKRKNYSLRKGAGNLETGLNTINAITGMIMTGVWGTATGITTATELALTYGAPTKVSKAVHKAATGEGLWATWDSIMCEESTDALADVVGGWKKSLIGSHNKSTKKAEKKAKKANATKHLDEAIANASKKERKEIEAALPMIKTVLGLSRKDVSKLIKKMGVEDAVTHIGKLMTEAQA